MDDEIFLIIVIFIGLMVLTVAIVGVCEHTSSVDDEDSVEFSDDLDENHVIIPISTGSGTNYAVI